MNDEYNYHKEHAPGGGTGEKYMDLRVDWAFKYIFSIKENLIKLLNDLLPHHITDLSYLGNEIPVKSSKDKKSRLDVLCESEEGKFIVEMQRRHEKDFDDRIAYYASVLVKNQVTKGKKKKRKLLYNVKHVYVLCVVDYLRPHPVSTPTDKFLFNYYYSDLDNNEVYTDGKISYHFLELRRFKEEDWNKLQKNPERWCYLFENMHKFAKTKEVPADLHGFDGIVDDAMLECLNDEQIMKYKKDKDFIEYQNYTMRLAAIEDAKAEVARSMLSDHIPVEVIAKHTGFTVDEIKQL